MGDQDNAMWTGQFAELLTFSLRGVALIGLLFVLLGAARIGNPRSSSRDGLFTGIGGVSLSAAALAVVAILPNPDTTDAESTDIPPVEPPPVTAAPEPPVVDTAPEAPVDWTPALWLCAALVAVALTAYLTIRTRSHIVDRRNARRALEADYAAAYAVFSDVADAYAAYLADPYAIFDRPLLDNLDEPRTAAFIDAFAAMNDIRPEQCPDTRERVQAFAVAARKARSAWHSADDYARAVGMTVTSADGIRTVRRIRSALGIALDLSATGQERETALRTVRELADGLIVIPDRIYVSAKIAIETTTRRELTS